MVPWKRLVNHTTAATICSVLTGFSFCWLLITCEELLIDLHKGIYISKSLCSSRPSVQFMKPFMLGVDILVLLLSAQSLNQH